MARTFLDVYCKYCGSRNVCRDATARWNIEAQKWELSDVQDHSDCENCNGETSLVDIEVDAATVALIVESEGVKPVRKGEPS